MSLEERKARLIEWLRSIDNEEVINQFEESRKAVDMGDSEVLGYSPTGRAFTKADLIKRIEETDAQIRRREFFTTDQVMAQFGIE